MADDLDDSSNANDVNSDEFVVEDRVVSPYKPLKPGEIPDFAPRQITVTRGNTTERRTVRPRFILSDGTKFESEAEFAGMCYIVQHNPALVVEGCGALRTERRCSDVQCTRLLCLKHAFQHPEQENVFLCEEHYNAFLRERWIRRFGVGLYWLFRASPLLLLLGVIILIWWRRW